MVNHTRGANGHPSHFGKCLDISSLYGAQHALAPLTIIAKALKPGPKKTVRPGIVPLQDID